MKTAALSKLFVPAVILMLIFPALSKGDGPGTPVTADDWRVQGLRYVGAKQYDKAMKAFDKAISLVPDYSMGYVFRGNLYDIQGDSDSAMADYAKAIELDPENYRAFWERGLAYGHKGMHEEAIEDFTRAIGIKANWAYYYNRGLAHVKSDKSDKLDAALEDFSMTIRLKYSYPMGYYDRGNVYSEKGEFELAIADYTQAIRYKPDLAAAYSRRGKIYEKTGNKDLAVKDLAKAAWLYNRMGIDYAEEDMLDEAEGYFESAIRARPEGIFGYYNMACLSSLRKEVEAACDYLKKAVKMGYDDWAEMKTDPSLDNIRGSECYRGIAAGK